MRRVPLNTCLTEQFQELFWILCFWLAIKTFLINRSLQEIQMGIDFVIVSAQGIFRSLWQLVILLLNVLSKGALLGTTQQTMQLNRKSDKMIRFEQDSNSDLCIYWTHAWQSRHISKVPLLCINWSKCARITITHIEKKWRIMKQQQLTTK